MTLAGDVQAETLLLWKGGRGIARSSGLYRNENHSDVGVLSSGLFNNSSSSAYPRPASGKVMILLISISYQTNSTAWYQVKKVI